MPLASLAASYPVVLRAMEEGTEEVMILNEIAWSEIVKKIMVLSYRMVRSRTLDVILSRASRAIVSRIKALTCDDLLDEEAAATPRTCPAGGSSNSEFVNRCAEELHKKTDLKRRTELFYSRSSRSTSRSGSTDLKTEDLKEELEAQIIILKNEIERLKEKPQEKSEEKPEEKSEEEPEERPEESEEMPEDLEEQIIILKNEIERFENEIERIKNAIDWQIYQPNCMRCDAWGGRREPVCRACGALAPPPEVPPPPPDDKGEGEPEERPEESEEKPATLPAPDFYMSDSEEEAMCRECLLRKEQKRATQLKWFKFALCAIKPTGRLQVMCGRKWQWRHPHVWIKRVKAEKMKAVEEAEKMKAEEKIKVCARGRRTGSACPLAFLAGVLEASGEDASTLRHLAKVAEDTPSVAACPSLISSSSCPSHISSSSSHPPAPAAAPMAGASV